MNNSLPPLDVCISIDAEFDINHSLGQPDSHTPIGFASMQRLVDGDSHGLGFILDTLGAHDLPATFFIEVFCAHLFGIREVQKMVAQIRAADSKHDIQLHAHPCWRYFRDPDWRNTVKTIRKNDSWAGRGAEALPMMRGAIELFTAIVGQPPLAFRSGNLQVDSDVHAALAQLGVPVSSSVGLGLTRPDEIALQRWITPTRLHGVLEVPVAAYTEPGLRGERIKCLTITGTSWPVTRGMLEWAHRTQSGPVVILTHASEFSTCINTEQGDPAQVGYRPNLLVQRRLQQLAKFLASERQRFNTTTFSASYATWQIGGERRDARFTAPRHASLLRAMENGWAQLHGYYRQT